MTSEQFKQHIESKIAEISQNENFSDNEGVFYCRVLSEINKGADIVSFLKKEMEIMDNVIRETAERLQENFNSIECLKYCESINNGTHPFQIKARQIRALYDMCS